MILSRCGLWMTDLTITQLMQEQVPTTQRSQVGGVQRALNSLMFLVQLLITIVVPTPSQFGSLILMSFAAALLAFFLYVVFLIKYGWHFAPDITDDNKQEIEAFPSTGDCDWLNNDAFMNNPSNGQIKKNNSSLYRNAEFLERDANGCDDICNLPSSSTNTSTPFYDGQGDTEKQKELDKLKYNDAEDCILNGNATEIIVPELETLLSNYIDDFDTLRPETPTLLPLAFSDDNVTIVSSSEIIDDLGDTRELFLNATNHY